jgi:hypothetical protein
MVSYTVLYKQDPNKRVELPVIDKFLRGIGYTIQDIEPPFRESQVGTISYLNETTKAGVNVSRWQASVGRSNYALTLPFNEEEKKRILDAMDREGLKLLGEE